MANYPGATLGGLSVAETPDYIEAIRNRTSPQVEPFGFLSDTLDATVFSGEQPIDIYGDVKPGAHLFTYFDDYYNKVYALPVRIDFGPISGVIKRKIVFWNAHLFSTTFSTATPTGLSNVFLTGPAMPRLLKPLEIVEYTIEASEEGAPALDGRFSLRFDHSGSFERVIVPVTGRRARVSPVGPNWRNSFTVTYEFRTEVMTSRNGREQRRALRQSPRKTIEFSASLVRSGLRRLNENMASWHSRTILMPERPRAVRSAVGMEAGADQLLLAGPAPSWAVAGAPVMLVFDRVEEPRAIAAVVGSTITFDSTSDTPFPAGTQMIAVVSGVFPEKLTTKRLTNAVAEVSVVFEVTPTSEIAIPVPPAPLLFNNREIFMLKPNWGDAVDTAYARPVEVTDFNRGKIARYSNIDFETVERKLNYISRNLAEAELIREFFYRMKGQRGEFYMPTWENDLIPAVTAPKETNTLRVDGFDIFENYGEDTVHKAFIAFPYQGDPEPRVIERIYRVDDQLGQHTAIQVNQPFSIDIAANKIRMISWLPMHRLTSDSLAIEWRTNTVAQFALAMKTIEDLP